ncbi:MAG TPA: hypothetical protein VG939_22485 [Caulobacteraceae bacterium]|nr:hypothetical protein [Caulobacteraceae bacterium]
MDNPSADVEPGDHRRVNGAGEGAKPQASRADEIRAKAAMIAERGRALNDQALSMRPGPDRENKLAHAEMLLRGAEEMEADAVRLEGRRGG